MIRDNLARVGTRIDAACRSAGRDPREITLVVVTKEVELDRIREARDCGIRIVGENRVQEAASKVPSLPELEWHMIGHLQTNKVRKAVELFSMVQSVDSLHLAQAIDQRTAKVMPVLIEVNTSGEASKFGVGSGDLPPLVEGVMGMSRLNLQGLMTIGPGLAVEDPEASRRSFKMLYRLRTELEKRYSIRLPVLSMGMSSDFEIGIEEGSTMVRLGTLIFGPRPA